MMDVNNKKISFGFSKAIKKPNLIKPVVQQKQNVQLIDCLEEQRIKVIGEKKEEKSALIIPLRQKEISSKEKLINNEEKDILHSNSEQSSNNVNATPTLDELAAQELLNDIKNSGLKNETKKLYTINMVENKGLLEGEKESTIEDYENIPVHDFGLAMLRGMGWEEGIGIGKNKQIISTSIPVVRPKGMGLGADKIIKLEQATAVKNEQNEDLQIIKGAYVKLLAGRFKDMYGQIEGLDDESGRLIIKMTLDGNNISVSEFIVKPITKDEYIKNSRVLNSSKYEEYKKRSETEQKTINDVKCDADSKIYSVNKKPSTTKSHNSTQKEDKYFKKTEDSCHKNTSQHTSSRNIELNSNYSNKSKENKIESVIISSSESEKEVYLERNKSYHRRYTKKSSSETSSDRSEKKSKHKKEKKKHKHYSKLKNDYENNDKKYNSSKRKHRHKSRS